MATATLPVQGRGLTSDEVAARVARGQVNTVANQVSRRVAAIVAANVLTRFNAILGGLLAVILVVGPGQDALFGFVLVANTLVGIVQELRAKWTLDRLAIVAAPRARVLRDGEPVEVAASAVVLDDLVELQAGDQIVVDGVVVSCEHLELDEALLSGESDPVVKQVGDELLSGSFVVAGTGTSTVTRVGPATYAAQLAERARRFTLVRSELRDGINRLLRLITWVMLPTAVLLLVGQLSRGHDLRAVARGTVAGVVTMVPEGLVLLASMALAIGVIRMARRRVLVQELPAVEGLARVDVVCVDKTGTLTTGRLSFTELVPLAGADRERTATALADFASAVEQPNASLQAIAAAFPVGSSRRATGQVPFSSARKYSSVTFADEGSWLLGAPEVLLSEAGPEVRSAVLGEVDRQVARGRRVLLFASTSEAPTDVQVPPDIRPAGLVVLTDETRPDAAATLRFFAEQGVAVKVLSGDHPRTVGTVAAALGLAGADHPVDARTLPEHPEEIARVLEDASVLGRVSPQQKQAVVGALQSSGHVVAMTGDGVNDVLALKDADIGIAMASGTSATRAVAQLVLLDDSFAALPGVVAEGRRIIANVERVANLFLAKTTYATLLALSVGVARLPFPFLPRHLTVVSSLTIGIPGFFLALSPNARRATPGFVSRVLRFAIPAGVVAAVATFGAYELARTEPDVSVPEEQTTAVLVLFGVAMWILAIAARPSTPARRWLLITMTVGFVVVLALPSSRTFFALDIPAPVVCLAAVGIVALADLALELGWRASRWIASRPVARRPRTP